MRNDEAAGRYELTVDGRPAGFAAYRLRPDTIVFTHTEVDPALEGRGLGGRLARAALDDVRARGRRVVPVCPFIAEYLRRHPDDVDLVEPDERDRLAPPPGG